MRYEVAPLLFAESNRYEGSTMLRAFDSITTHDLVICLIGALIAATTSLSVWLITRYYESLRSGRGLPYRIAGNWYSLEYVPKSAGECNTYTEVRVKRNLGGRWSIKVVKQLYPGEGENEQTAWSMIGTIPYGGDTLVGQWRSSIPDTKRYGCAVLKFIDNARAIGYWTGPSRRDYPVYGYWVMKF